MTPLITQASFLKMEAAGRLLAEIFDQLTEKVIAGVSTLAIDSLIERELQARHLVSGCKGYKGYKHVSCISIGDEVVHGIPSVKRIIKPGDLVKVDVCASYRGFFADMARTYLVLPVDPINQKLVNVAQFALDRGIECAIVGNRVSDISAVIQRSVEDQGFGVVRDFAGHGIGMSMHQDPEILNYGLPGKGPFLRAGMGLALEPMITRCRYDVYVALDGWTVKTVDGSFAAHVEDTVIVTDNGPVVITRPGRG